MQTRGARVDGEMRLKRERERETQFAWRRKRYYKQKGRGRKHIRLYTERRERRKAKEGRFKRGSRRDGVTS